MPTEEVKKTTPTPGANQSFFYRIRWGESYVSLLLGAIVVVIAAFLGFFYVKLHQPKQELLPPVTISRNVKLTPANPSQAVTSVPMAITPTTMKIATVTIVPTEKITHQITQKIISPTSTITPLPTKAKPNQGNNLTRERTYVVQKNDNLWDIAQKEYGSGYNYVGIIRANNLQNPRMIFSGNVLIIPVATPILVQNTPQATITLTPTPTKKPVPTMTPGIPQHNAISGSDYTVQKGDTLWDIAVRAYGDGYKWVTIAKANNLVNPSIIHSGNILNIPRQQTL